MQQDKTSPDKMPYDKKFLHKVSQQQYVMQTKFGMSDMYFKKERKKERKKNLFAQKASQYLIKNYIVSLSEWYYNRKC